MHNVKKENVQFTNNSKNSIREEMRDEILFEKVLVKTAGLWYNVGKDFIGRRGAYERPNCDSGCQRE